MSALEVRGHETVVLVNTSRSLSCSTHLEVTRMEWLLGDSVMGQNLELPLMPDNVGLNVGLNGAEFTCRVTTARGKTFSETITIEVRGERAPLCNPPASVWCDHGVMA